MAAFVVMSTESLKGLLNAQGHITFFSVHFSTGYMLPSSLEMHILLPRLRTNPRRKSLPFSYMPTQCFSALPDCENHLGARYLSPIKSKCSCEGHESLHFKLASTMIFSLNTFRSRSTVCSMPPDPASTSLGP